MFHISSVINDNSIGCNQIVVWPDFHNLGDLDSCLNYIWHPNSKKVQEEYLCTLNFRRCNSKTNMKIARNEVTNFEILNDERTLLCLSHLNPLSSIDWSTKLNRTFCPNSKHFFETFVEHGQIFVAFIALTYYCNSLYIYFSMTLLSKSLRENTIILQLLPNKTTLVSVAWYEL